ncbi:MAG TPA: hypothetical protein VNI83_08405 [Vicinamibacterales bacterium]|nr:hypothetical protein [Vicinamibacterales bacterium]
MLRVRVEGVVVPARWGCRFSERSAATVGLRRLGLAAALVVGLAVLNLHAPASPTAWQRALASALLLLCAVPTLLWLRSDRTSIPFLPLLAGIYGIYYALPVFVLERYARAWYLQDTISDAAIERALALSIVGFVALLAGYYGTRGSLLCRVAKRVNPRWPSDRHAARVAVTLGLFGIGAYYVDVAASLPPWLEQPLGFAGDLRLVSISALVILQAAGQPRPSEVAFLWLGMVPASVALGLSTGALFQALRVVFVVALTSAAVRRRLPWKLLAATGLLLLVLFPARNEFRALTWGGPAQDAGPVQKAVLYLTVLRDYLLGGALPFRDAAQIAMSRLGHLPTFAAVTEMTPSVVPFLHGTTYYPLLSKPVPRLLWPDKPMETTGQEFGHLYGWLAPEDTETSYNLPQLVEFYLNFGGIGVVVGMLALGALYKAIHGMFGTGIGSGETVAGVYMMSGLLSIESSLSLVLGGVFWAFVFVVGVNWVVKASFRQEPQPAPWQRGRCKLEAESA